MRKFYSFTLLICLTLAETWWGGSTCFAQRVGIEFVTPSIVHIRISHDNELRDNNTGACVYPKPNVKFEKKYDKNELIMSSSELVVVLDTISGGIYIEDMDEDVLFNQFVPKWEPVYQERVIYDESSAHVEETANGKVTVKDEIRRDTIGRSMRYMVSFRFNDEKAVYGLGAHMEDYMNLQGKTMYLTQHNLKAMVPMLVTNTGCGLLFDAGCAMKFVSDEAKNHGCGHCTGYVYSMQYEAAKSYDYYFIKGEKPEDAIAGYRYLTGNVSMMPRYVFGYTQSKERYVSSDDITNTLREYRHRHVPIDMIVQDWNYWPQGWGYMKMNPKYYPSPKALADSVHAMNAKLMVSIWPNPQWCPEAEDFKSRGMMLEHDVYDVFNPEARKHYWKYANDEFFSQGFDAWWCDSSEPLDGDWNRIPATTPDGKKYDWNSQEYRWKLNKDVLSEALGAERSSLYSLYHSMGIYENQRNEYVNDNVNDNDNDNKAVKRVVNLTRSSYSGQQRYGTIVWNGDTHASWKSFRQQIPSGLNYMATGNPYWTVDVGSFFTRNDGRRWFYQGEFPNGVKDDNYKEYYVRMFQWGTFLPMLRSHGSDTPREIWQFITDKEKANNTELADCKYAGAVLDMINLRYTLIPYIYSMAAKQSGSGFSMARPLGFDFPQDDAALDIKDEYMFGDYLVCPVTQPLSETTVRKVYLPKGETWTDHWTHKTYEGGQVIDYDLTQCNTTLGNDGAVKVFPLFIMSGAIITTTEVAEYSDAQFGKPVTITVTPGKDAEFTLYEDEGDNYNFEKGAYSTIKLTWNEAKRTLTIGERNGSFPGMLTTRTFLVNTSKGIKKVKYTGKLKNLRI